MREITDLAMNGLGRLGAEGSVLMHDPLQLMDEWGPEKVASRRRCRVRTAMILRGRIPAHER